MLDLLVNLLALILLFFLPGFFLALIIWPDKDHFNADYDILIKCVFGIIFSMIIMILVGIVLYGIGSLSAPSEVQSMRLWLTLGIISAFLGIISWKKGGLRNLVARKPGAKKGGLSIDDELNKLSAEKRKLQSKIILMESEEYKSDQALREEAAVRIPMLKKEIADVNKKIDELIEREEKNGGEKTA